MNHETNASRSNQETEPLVSVIIPAYNARHFLNECLESIYSQTYQKIEIIVTDDGSTDDTVEWLRINHPAVHCISQENSGACSSPRNTGAKAASGSLLAFLDADDIFLPDNIETHVRNLSAFPTAVASITNYQNFDHDTGNAIGDSHFKTCPSIVDFLSLEASESTILPGIKARQILAKENFSIASGVVIGAEAFTELGGFDEDLLASEDFDFVFRSARVGDLVLSPNVGFRRRVHLDNMSNQSRRILEQKVNSRKMLRDAESDDVARKLLTDAYSELLLSVALASGTFSRSERTAALFRSLANPSIIKPLHAKAGLKLIVP